MRLTTQLNQLSNYYLKTVQTRPQHHLKPSERFLLYKSFGKSRLSQPSYSKIRSVYDYEQTLQHYVNELANLTFADHVLGWLAILTVQQALFTWDQFDEQIREQHFVDGLNIRPHTIVEAAETVLIGTADLDKVFGDAVGDYHMGSTITNFVTYDLACTYTAANSALSVILYGGNILDDDASFIDDDISYIFGDFASEAVKAYSVIDTNKPGAWQQEGLRRLELGLQDLAANPQVDPIVKKALGLDSPTDEEVLSRLGFLSHEFEEWQIEKSEQTKSYQQQTFDPTKRLEFWQWWLTEAIPQAWEMANQTFS